MAEKSTKKKNAKMNTAHLDLIEFIFYKSISLTLLDPLAIFSSVLCPELQEFVLLSHGWSNLTEAEPFLLKLILMISDIAHSP